MAQIYVALSDGTVLDEAIRRATTRCFGLMVSWSRICQLGPGRRNPDYGLGRCRGGGGGGGGVLTGIDEGS